MRITSSLLLALPAVAPPVTAGGDACPFEARADSPVDRFETGAAVVDGRVYLFGGFYTPAIEATARVDRYDPTTDLWTPMADMPVPVTHVAAVRDGDFVWFFGGFVGDDPGTPSTDALRYGLSTDTWELVPEAALPEARAAGGVVLVDRELHYFGGVLPDRQHSTTDHWVLDLDDLGSGWDTQSAAPMPTPRNHFGFALHAGRIYAIGGQDIHDPITQPWGTQYAVDLATVEAYDPQTNTWTTLADMPRPRSHFEAAVTEYDGRLWIAGGQDSVAADPALASVLSYDAQTDAWQDEPPLPVGVNGPCFQLVGDSFFLSTGKDDPVTPQDASFLRKASPREGCLAGDVSAIATGAGGTQTFTIDAGPGRSGAIYLLLGSATGQFPATPIDGLHLPLVADAYTQLTIQLANGAFLAQSLGFLDGQGQATAAFTLPAGLAELAGLELHHAYLTLDPLTFGFDAASNAVGVALLP